MSEALPNTQGEGTGRLHILYGDGFKPVGYMVEKICVTDAWESMDPRYFITTSHAEALRMLSLEFEELPARQTATA